MVLTLVLMVSGKTPLYLTAIIGSVTAAIAAGIPFNPPAAVDGVVGTSVRAMFNAGLHPVLVDMLGVLLFIGIMEKVGYLEIIVNKIMSIGKLLGGGAGIAGAGAVSAGVIGGLTGFTQPAITAVITGPAAIKLGVDKHKAAGMSGLAGILGNYGGFTHPTMIAVVATTGITFGMINVIGASVAMVTIVVAFILISREVKASGAAAEVSGADVQLGIKEVSSNQAFKAIAPFIVLIVGFVTGYPIIVVGIISAIVAIALSGINIAEGENAMRDGLVRITTPLLATVGFLFMGAVIVQVGLTTLISDVLGPALSVAPIQTILLVGALAGFITQSNSASIPIVLAVLYPAINYFGADPFAAAVVAAGGPAIMQYYLTGGPIAALATVIPVIPGSDLKTANKFQRLPILAALGALLLVSFIV